MNKRRIFVKTITEVIGMNKNKKLAAAFTLIFTAAATMAGAYALGNFTTKDGSGYVDLSEVDENKTAKNENTTEDIKTAKADDVTGSEFGMDNVMDATDEYVEESTKTAGVDSKEQSEESLAKNSDTKEDTETNLAENSNTKEGVETNLAENSDIKKVTEESFAKNEETEDNTTEVMSGSAVNESLPAEINFQAEDKLMWPVTGDIIMNYSMDTTTYFKTLDQYKYNPAVMIGCEVGSDVLAAADGKVLSVENTDETGTTIIVDMGNGYQATYGQLKDVSCEAGDLCKAGEVIGKVSEPSRYYSLEGSNLYLKMEKDGAPVDPMSFLE